MSGQMRVVPESVGAEIIEIGDLERTERLDIKRPEWDACKHRRTLIDEQLRIVTCKDCAERLDPVEVLIDIARAWRSESFHAKRIAEYETKRFDEATERDKRFVRQHVVCNGCGLQTRLTVGKLTEADMRLWAGHWGTEPEHPATWDATKMIPERTHRRRVEADIDANRRRIEPVGRSG